MRRIALIASLLAGCTFEVDLGALLAGSDARDDTGVIDVTAPAEVDVVDPDAPCLTVSPPRVDFGVVPKDRLETRTFALSNRCDADLAWLGFSLVGDRAFEIVADGGAWAALSPTEPREVTFGAPLIVPAQASVLAVVRFTAPQAARRGASAILHVDDPHLPHGIALQINAGGEQPCLVAAPKDVDFGGKVVDTATEREVTLRSCGALPVRLDGVRLSDLDGRAGQPFAIDASRLPRELAPGAEAQLTVTYAPTEVTLEGGGPRRTFDLGRVVISTNAFEAETRVDLRGFGVAEPCPEARITLGVEGDVVRVGDTIQLSSEESFAVDGPISAWDWTIVGPVGGVTLIEPSPAAPAIRTRLTLTGDYEIQLLVWDALGRRACSVARQTITARAAAAARVELVWITPNDDDPHDTGLGAGADLDLHVAHSFAVGPDLDGDGVGDRWFDRPFDVFFDNRAPAWSSLTGASPNADPRLLEDDYDGNGPEVVELQEVAPDLAFRVGVHAWDDHGFGRSAAIVRVVIDGVVTWESPPTDLADDELWDVVTIRWPGPVVTPVSKPEDAPRLLRNVRDKAGFYK